MESSRAIDNLEADRLRKENAAKEEEKKQRDASRTAKGAQGEQVVVVRWASRVVQ